MNETSSSIKTNQLMLEAPIPEKIALTKQQDITNYTRCTETNSNYDYQKPNIFYKYIEKYKVQLIDDEIDFNLLCKLNSALIDDLDGTIVKNILMEHPIILTKLLCSSLYIQQMKVDIKRNNNIDAILYCIAKQDKIDLIPQYLKELFFIYACQHPEKDYAEAVINLYKAKAYFFEPTYITTIHDLYLNKNIKVAINTSTSIEDKMHSNNLFKARYQIKQENIFKSIDYLDVDTLSLKSKTQNIFSDTKRFIKNLKSIAIYLYSEYYQDGAKKFHSFGDENACLNILNQLISLGIKEVTIYVSPPDPLITYHKRKDYYYCQQYQDQKRKADVVHKLSFLLDNINPKLGLPQSIVKSGCIVNIRFIDEISSNNETIQEQIRSFIESTVGIKYLSDHEELRASTIKENLVFVFDQGKFKYNNQNLSNSITIFPFSWGMHRENITFASTNIKPSSKINCKNPAYSILREQESTLPIKYIGINLYKNWLFDLLITTKSNNEAAILSSIINLIAENIKNKKIQHSAIYGLHHPYVKDNAEAILSTWVNSATELSVNLQQPIILSVISNTLVINKQQFNNENTIVIDLLECENESDFIDQINTYLEDNKTIVLFFPSLPKPVFHSLIDNTTMPILVEGANITSYALQTGKPYLSVLPSGSTEIPTKMGDPWIEFLQESLSYKLAFIKEFLNHFHILFSYVTNYNYQQAIDYIDDLKQLDNTGGSKKLIEFFQKQNSNNISIAETSEITLLSLLKKGNALSDHDRKYLLQALDPNVSSISSYIKNCLDEDSKEINHYKLMQHHVNLAINDKVIIALNKFITEFKNREDA